MYFWKKITRLERKTLFLQPKQSTDNDEKKYFRTAGRFGGMQLWQQEGGWGQGSDESENPDGVSHFHG
jgi:hypothetical protein